MNALKQNLFAAIDFLIEVEAGPDAGKAFRIQPPRIVVGRDQRCQIRLSDPKTSRQQLEIRFGSNIVIKDLSSRKTTLVNGKACVMDTILRPGDIISFGQTKIKFNTRTNKNARPELPGQTAAASAKRKEKEKGRRTFYNFMGVILLMAVGLKLLQQEPLVKKEEKLATVEDLTKQIEETRERTSLLSQEKLDRRNKLNQEKYLNQVESHFVRGFRDYQNGRYGRALDALGTTLSTDQNHNQAQLYSKTARKKREELIDIHLRDGQKYKDKLMFNRCAAEFEKALIYIDDSRSKKFSLAREQLKECRLLMTGGYE